MKPRFYNKLNGFILKKLFVPDIRNESEILDDLTNGHSTWIFWGRKFQRYIKQT